MQFIETFERSEYSVVEQLKELPIQISILSLLLSSEEYRDALLKILKGSHVPEGIIAKELEQTVDRLHELLQ